VYPNAGHRSAAFERGVTLIRSQLPPIIFARMLRGKGVISHSCQLDHAHRAAHPVVGNNLSFAKNSCRKKRYSWLSTIPRLMLHNLNATGSGSVEITFHQGSSCPIWWFSRW
jgi:hypothetical protein